MSETEQDLHELRDLYANMPQLPRIPLEEVRRGARRRQLRRSAVVAGGGSLAVAAIVLPFVFGSVGSDSPAPDRPRDGSGPVSQPPDRPQGVVPDVAAMRAATDAAYSALDADPDLGYYMLRTDAKRITLWGNLTPPTLTEVQEAIDPTGAELQVRSLPDNLDPHGLQAAADAASEQMRDLAADPEYGFNQLKLQLPLRGVIIWRVNSNTRVDDELRAIARDAGLDMEIRTATVSRADAQQTSASLRAANDSWRGDGFQVIGCFARPSGLIVTVEGDTSAAEQELVGTNGVIGVMNGTMVYSTID